MKKLRISHVLVQPVLVWDDGNELTPGPEAAPKAVTVSGLADLGEQMTAQLADVEAQALAAEAPKPNRAQRRAKPTT